MWLRGHSRSLKVETGAIQKFGCGFLFAYYSNYGAILYRLRDIATYFYTPPVFSAPAWGDFVKMFDADKTRMIVLPYHPYGEKL